MARKKPVKKAKKKAAKPAARKAAKKATRKVARQPARKAAKKPARKAKPVAKKKTPAKKAAPAAKASVGKAKRPNLDRPRKTVADIHGLPSSLDMDRTASAVRTGRAELQERLHKNTSTSPALTAGDVDADWESAESSGDEAPGGDNPTPDQDVVDEIGRALGVEYEDDEELQGGAEITERDRHRWELDPSSKDDFDEE
jgi:hypothetical protein